MKYAQLYGSGNYGGFQQQPAIGLLGQGWLSTGTSPCTITITGNIIGAEPPVKVSDKEYLVVDIDAGVNVASEKTLEDAENAARTKAGASDHRIVIFQPIAVHEPDKKTIRRAITLAP